MAPPPSSFDAHAPAEGFRLKGDAKLAFVTDMFDRVAPTYDLLNWFISLGQTTLWRLMALSWLHPRLRPRAKVLDVGCGTGWVTWYFRRRYAALDLDVVGMDCNPSMLDEARRVAPAPTSAAATSAPSTIRTTHSTSSPPCTLCVTSRTFEGACARCTGSPRREAPVVILDAFPLQPRDTGGALPVARVHHALRRRPVHQRRQSVQVPQREHTVDDTSGECGGDVAGMRGGGGVDDSTPSARRRMRRLETQTRSVTERQRTRLGSGSRQAKPWIWWSARY